ncbi:MAG: WG repeat-containing protein [Chitinophagales bacterium]|nr:WG repeat-containing protein [Chitinophagales bacterium]
MIKKIFFVFCCYCYLLCSAVQMKAQAGRPESVVNDYPVTVSTPDFMLVEDADNDDPINTFFEGKLFVQIQGRCYGERSYFGLTDKKGKIMYPYYFTSASFFSSELLFICAETDCSMPYRCGLMNKKGEFVKPLSYTEDDTHFPSKDYPLGCLRRDSLLFAVDIKGNIIDTLTPKGLTYTANNGHAYFIKPNGYAIYAPTSTFGRIVNEFKHNDRIGLRDTVTKEVIIPAEYDLVYNSYEDMRTTHHVFVVQKDSLYGLFGVDGTNLLPTEYDHIYWFAKDCYIVKKNGLSGVYQLRHKVIIPPTMSLIISIFNASSNELYHLGYTTDIRQKTLFAPDGRIIVKDFVCDSFFPWQNIICFLVNNKWGIMDKTGKIIQEPIYNSVGTRKSGDSRFLNVDNGYINADGKEVVRHERYQDISAFGRDKKAFFVRHDGTCGWVNARGKEQNIAVPTDGFYKIMSDNVFNQKQPYFEEKRRAGLKEGLLDRHGKVIAPPIYDQIEPFNNGMAIVRIGNKLGIINHRGKLVVPVIYDYGSNTPVSNKKAIILRKNEAFFLINPTTGAVLSQLSRHYYLYDKRGLYIVARDTSINNEKKRTFVGLLDSQGKTILPMDYERIHFPSDDMIAVCKNGLWGYCNMQGQELIPLQYSVAGDFCGGEATVTVQYGNTLVIDKTGKCIARCENQK